MPVGRPDAEGSGDFDRGRFPGLVVPHVQHRDRHSGLYPRSSKTPDSSPMVFAGSSASNRAGGFRPKSSSEHADLFPQSSANRRAITPFLAHFCRRRQGMLKELQQLGSFPIIEFQGKLVGWFRFTGFCTIGLILKAMRFLAPLPARTHIPITGSFPN